MNWSLAFATFVATCTHYYPNKAAQLLAYSSIIFLLAQEVGGSAWQHYDWAFCQVATVNPALSWDKRELDIWLNFLVGESQSRGAGSSYSAIPQKRPSGTEACLRWNWGSCYSTPCRYLHRCIQCQIILACNSESIFATATFCLQGRVICKKAISVLLKVSICD